MKTIKFYNTLITILAQYEQNEAAKSLIIPEMEKMVIEDVKKRTGNEVCTVNLYLRDNEKEVFVPCGYAGNAIYSTVLRDGMWYLIRKDYDRVEV